MRAKELLEFTRKGYIPHGEEVSINFEGENIGTLFVDGVPAERRYGLEADRLKLQGRLLLSASMSLWTLAR